MAKDPLTPLFNEKAKRARVIKDNAQPRVPPPVQAHKPAPHLAPPGMAGINPVKRFALHNGTIPRAQLPNKSQEQQAALKRTFRSFAQRAPGQERDIER
jgi:hypothetical protein